MKMVEKKNTMVVMRGMALKVAQSVADVQHQWEEDKQRRASSVDDTPCAKEGNGS